MKIFNQLMRSKKHIGLSMSALLFFAGSLDAATVVVPYPIPGGNTVQTYVNMLNNGDTLQFSAGTYTNVSQFYLVSTSTHPLTNITVVGAGNGINGTVIQAPPSTTLLNSSQSFSYPLGGSSPIPKYWSIINIDNQNGTNPFNVNISNLAVDGNNQQDNTFYEVGNISGDNNFCAIGLHNSGGTLTNVHTTNTRQSTAITNPSDGTGIGIFNGVDTGSATLNVNNCYIDFYQRYGIKCSGANLTANITNSVVNRGYILAPSPHGTTTAPNGIEFASGATGTISGNSVENNVSADATGGGSGIIIYAATATITGNTVNSNDNAIVSLSSGNTTISDNRVTFTAPPSQISSIEGILVYYPTGTTVVDSNVVDFSLINNLVSPYSTYFMDLETTTNATITLTHNQFLGSNAANQIGMYIQGGGTAATSPVITMNGEIFTGFTTSGALYVDEVTASNNIWPSSQNVSYDGLVPGYMTQAQYNNLVPHKIIDQNSNASLGLVISYLSPILAPPSNFQGNIITFRIGNNVKYLFETTWVASPTANVSYYAIYDNGTLVAEIPGNAPLVYNQYVNSFYEASTFEIATVNTSNQQSTPVPVVIQSH